MRNTLRLQIVASVLIAGTVGCSSERSRPQTSDAVAVIDTSTTLAATDPTIAATTTSIDLAAGANQYAQAGPYPVGVTTVVLPTGVNVEIWYPAIETTAPATQTYDVRDFTPPAIKALLTADIPATVSYPGSRDAVIADGQFGVVLNSHGYSGIRIGSSFLTAHLASWGVIVVSPDHPTRDLFHAVSQIPPDVITEPVDDLLASLDYISAAANTPGSIFEGHVDARSRRCSWSFRRWRHRAAGRN